MDFVDKLAFDDAKARRTQDGFLVAMPRVARTGIQKYLGSEVGKPDMPVVKVYRPEDEVFHKDAFASIAHRPITINHPNQSVNSKTWKDVSVGQTDGEVVRDGVYVRVPMMVMDAKAIKLIETGDNAELSLGYTAELDWTPGQTTDGEAYDAVQRQIRVNHLAVVGHARGGAALRIGDAVPTLKEKNVMEKTIVLDGVNLTMDATIADVVNATVKRLERQVSDAEKTKVEAEEEKKKIKADADAAIADHKKVVETKDAEITTLKQQVTDSTITPTKLDGLVSARVDTITKAKAILGDALVIKDKSDSEIRRQVVDKKLGDAAKGWSDDAVMASFNTITAMASGTQQSSGTTVGDAARAFSTPTTTADFGDVEKAYVDYNKSLGDAYKTAGRVAA
jgi:hypothetical protein